MEERIKGNLVIFSMPTKKNPLFPKKTVDSQGKLSSLGKMMCPFGNCPIS